MIIIVKTAWLSSVRTMAPKRDNNQIFLLVIFTIFTQRNVLTETIWNPRQVGQKLIWQMVIILYILKKIQELRWNLISAMVNLSIL